MGKTGLKVSEVGFGAWAIGGNAHGNSYGPTDDKSSLDSVKKALDLGCTFFDTADVYGHGHSEELLGKALEGRRDEVVIATKVGGDFYHGTPRMNFTPEYLLFALQKSLERLQTNYIDVYQLHTPPVQLVKNPGLFRVLEDIEKTGKIRHYGISIHNPAEGILAMKTGHPSTIQVVFNILRQEAKNELFGLARENKVAIIAREPLANGFLTGKRKREETFPEGDIRHNFPRNYIASMIHSAEKLRFLEQKGRTLAQAAIRFTLDNADVSTTIPGAKTAEQVQENIQASDLPSLTGEDLMRIRFLRESSFE